MKPTLDEWADNVYTVAAELGGSLKTSATVVSGHYRGPIVADKFKRFASVGFVSSSWLRTEDGTIIDPVRWIYEGKDPYIFVAAPSEPGHSDYDADREILRSALPSPCPPANVSEEIIMGCTSHDAPVLRRDCEVDSAKLGTRLDVSDDAWKFLRSLSTNIVPAGVNAAQAEWLVNLPQELLGDFADEICVAIEKAEFEPSLGEDQ